MKKGRWRRRRRAGRQRTYELLASKKAIRHELAGAHSTALVLRHGFFRAESEHRDANKEREGVRE